MKFTLSLKNNYEFRRLYSKGKSTFSSLAAVYCQKNRLTVNRIGITVSTKIGHAVVRNRIRRRFHEIYRTNESGFRQGYDVVFVARTKSRYAKYSDLEKDLLAICKKLGIYNGD